MSEAHTAFIYNYSPFGSEISLFELLVITVFVADSV